MRRLMLALALLVEWLVSEMQWRRDERKRRRLEDETERLRQDPVNWWVDNFGASDVGDDVRLRDVTREAASSSKANADDHSG